MKGTGKKDLWYNQERKLLFIYFTEIFIGVCKNWVVENSVINVWGGPNLFCSFFNRTSKYK